MSNLFQANRMDKIPFSGIRRVFEEIGRLEKKGEKVINLSIGRPNFDTPSHIKNAALNALNQGKVHYTSNYGIDGLQDALKQKLKKENRMIVEDKELIITVGASEAVFLAFMALLNPGDEVLVPNPSWLNYFYCTELAGAHSVSYSLSEENNFNINVQGLEKLITEKTKMIVINTPHNPTGAVTSKETLEQISKLAQKHDLIVLSDEIYEKLIYDDVKHYSLASFPNMKERTVTINGFSKAYSMTGWRIGYIAGPRNLINAMVRVHQYTVTCPTSFAQYGAEEALRGPQDCVEQMRVEFNQRRKLVVERIKEIKGLNVVIPKGAFYAFVNIKGLGMNSEDASNYLLQKSGVAMVPGSAFGDFGEGFLRISFANSYENIEQALDKIESAVLRINTKV